MPCSSRIISGMLPEIHTIKKFELLISMYHSQIIYFFILCQPNISETLHEFYYDSDLNQYFNFCWFFLMQQKIKQADWMWDSIVFF